MLAPASIQCRNFSISFRRNDVGSSPFGGCGCARGAALNLKLRWKLLMLSESSLMWVNVGRLYDVLIIVPLSSRRCISRSYSSVCWSDYQGNSRHSQIIKQHFMPDSRPLLLRNLHFSFLLVALVLHCSDSVNVLGLLILITDYQGPMELIQTPALITGELNLSLVFWLLSSNYESI